MFELIVLLIGLWWAIWLGRLIRFGVASATQIVQNTEKAAHYAQMMYLALPPELRERSEATFVSLQPASVPPAPKKATKFGTSAFSWK